MYLLGLLSLVDAAVDQPMEELIGQLPLDTDVRDVLLGGGDDALARVLSLLQAYQNGDRSPSRNSAASP